MHSHSVLQSRMPARAGDLSLRRPLAPRRRSSWVGSSSLRLTRSTRRWNRQKSSRSRNTALSRFALSYRCEMENGSGRVDDVLRDTCRAEYGRILSVVLRILGDLEDAEDVLQSAVERALLRWAERGIPSNPAAWLTTVAKRIAIDQIRRRRRKAAAEDRLIRASEAVGIRQREQRPLSEWPDERLGLMALCCSAALTPQDRAALTLREVAGLSRCLPG